MRVSLPAATAPGGSGSPSGKTYATTSGLPGAAMAGRTEHTDRVIAIASMATMRLIAMRQARCDDPVARVALFCALAPEAELLSLRAAALSAAMRMDQIPVCSRKNRLPRTGLVYT